MIPYVLAGGALLWMYLMHTRSLPLEGCRGCLNLVMGVYYYALVAVPAWGMVHGQTRYTAGEMGNMALSAEAVLVAWVIGFVIAVLSMPDEHVGPVMFIACAVLTIIVWDDQWRWLPWYEALFGLYAWEVLLHN